MDKKNTAIWILAILLSISVAINAAAIFQAARYYQRLSQIYVEDKDSTQQNKQEDNSLQIANPASVNCVNRGGTLVMKKNGTENQYGLCFFDDNRACEEWSMLRGDCPVGGRKTTGYDTESQRYCAWLGGSTIAEEGAKCTFNDGSICDNEDLYNGKCYKGSVIK